MESEQGPDLAHLVFSPGLRFLASLEILLISRISFSCKLNRA